MGSSTLSLKKNKIKNKTVQNWLQREVDVYMHDQFMQRYPDTYSASYEDEQDFNIIHKQNRTYLLDDLYSYPYDFYKQYKVLQDKYFNYGGNFQQDIRFWGVKKLPGNTSPFLVRGKGSNLFAAGDRRYTSPYIKLFGWYNLYKDQQYDNPFLLNTNIFESYEVSTIQSTTRMVLHSVLKEKVPIKKVNGYEAILCDFKGVHPQFPVDLFGKENIEIVEVGSYLGKHIDFIHMPNNKSILKRLNDDRSWHMNWRPRYEEVFNFLEGHYHQINVYQKGKLVFRIPAGKKPLRVNIDYFDYRSWQGFCQFVLWFFFNVTEWQDDKQYFSVEV